MESWDAEAQVDYEECTAIYEHVGNFDRERANCRTYADVLSGTR